MSFFFTWLSLLYLQPQISNTPAKGNVVTSWNDTAFKHRPPNSQPLFGMYSMTRPAGAGTNQTTRVHSALWDKWCCSERDLERKIFQELWDWMWIDLSFDPQHSSFLDSGEACTYSLLLFYDTHLVTVTNDSDENRRRTEPVGWMNESFCGKLKEENIRKFFLLKLRLENRH